jgi:hypothetical protein
MTGVVDWSGRLYGRLLLLYPADLRREFGAEMALVFGEDLAAAFREAGAAGVLRVWRNAVREVLRIALPPLMAKPIVAVPVFSFAVNFLWSSFEMLVASFGRPAPHAHAAPWYLMVLGFALMSLISAAISAAACIGRNRPVVTSLGLRAD